MRAFEAKIGAVLFLLLIIGLVVFFIYNQEQGKNSSAGDFYPAQYYEALDNKMVRCNLCPNRCVLSEGQIGVCRARKNIAGKLYSMNYGQVSSVHLDPIEKKPLYHFLPGTKTYSLGTTGCNLQCKFCQNWQIAQVFPWDVQSIKMSPEEIVQEALKSGAQSIAFTYNEPTVFYEFMLDTAKIAHQQGLKNVVVSSGYINPEPLQELLPYIDAYKIDLKGIKPEFYQKITRGRVEPVLQAMKTIKEKGVWLEVVNLVIPGENDSNEDLKNLILWVKDNLGPKTPLHFTRFHPDYKLLNAPPTPIETLKKARKMALDLGMKYVYTGNIDDPEGSATYCPNSQEPVIIRQGFFTLEDKLKNGQCPNGEIIPGVWK